MGDLVPYAAGANMALALSQKTPEVLEEEQQQRIQEALVLEEKLKVIQESVPTRIYNTCSSSAGAGSSDFHMYRMIRKTEQERWKRIEAADKAAQERQAFEAKRKERETELEQKTAKNRAKRQKKKAKAKASKVKGDGSAGQEPATGSGDDSDEAPAAKDALPQADLD